VITYVHAITIVTVFATIYSVTVVNAYCPLLPWLLAVIMGTTDFGDRAIVAPTSRVRASVTLVLLIVRS
jgi:hypothetical protein